MIAFNIDGTRVRATGSESDSEERYTWFEHRHRFAVWAAARAAQRGFTSVDVLREALESTSVQSVLERRDSLNTDSATFESWHRDWCRGICRYIAERGIDGATYGRAAKLVAIYLKTMVVIGPDHDSALAGVIHPPIDRLLLQNLAAAPGVDRRLRAKWRTVSWTALDERGYHELLTELRTVLTPDEPWWMLERFWTVSGRS